MFLVEFEGYDLTKYNDFLIECSNKNYLEEKIHKHHILPKFMGGCNEKSNLIVLSNLDHFNAHLILAECFPENTNYYQGNVYAATRLKESNEIPKNFNVVPACTFTGRKHTEETKQRMSAAKKGIPKPRWIIENLIASRRGKKHTEEHKKYLSEIQKNLYATGQKVVNFGDRNSPARIRYREIMSERGKTQQNGKYNLMSKRVQHVESGEIFECLKDALNAFGFTNYNILRRKIDKGIFKILDNKTHNYVSGIRHYKSKRVVNVQSGEIFYTIKSAMLHIGITNYSEFNGLIKSGNFKFLLPTKLLIKKDKKYLKRL